jgi:hypothetical protein
MNVDAVVLGILAIADLAFLKHLRHRRWVATEEERLKERMALSLAMAVRRENRLIELEEPRPEALAKAS